MSQASVSLRDSDAALPESELTLPSHQISPNPDDFDFLLQTVIEVPVDTAAGAAFSPNNAQEAGTSNRLVHFRFVHELRDRVICDSILIFLRSTHDEYVRTQAHGMIRDILKIMVSCPIGAEYLQEHGHTGPRCLS